MQNIVYLGVGEIKKLEYPLFSWANLYMDIKYELIQNGYAWEIDWQEDINLDKVNECLFLKELAWVILNSGMRETVIRNIFPKISSAFYDWESAYTIQLNSVKCFQKAISIFNNQRKIKAIIEGAEILTNKGLKKIKKDLIKNGPTSLKIFPFIGSVTCFHLAKNVGYSTTKPDRHLVRLSKIAGFKSSDQFCDEISNITGDRPAVVDIIFWRYASLNSDYMNNIPKQLSEFRNSRDTMLNSNQKMLVPR